MKKYRLPHAAVSRLSLCAGVRPANYHADDKLIYLKMRLIMFGDLWQACAAPSSPPTARNGDDRIRRRIQYFGQPIRFEPSPILSRRSELRG